MNNRVEEEEKEDDASERGGVRWFDVCWRLGLTYKEGDSVVTMGGSMEVVEVGGTTVCKRDS